ncbi:MAG: protein kinase, partial [Kiritimatiellae bacterium]|nr:protein kinase [Kiritimatiellia bacterium]
MDFDEKSLGSAPTMVGGTDGGAGRPSEPQDYVSLGSAPTMAGGASRPGEPPSLGQIDQYQLVRKLGGGGFGVVYLARDTVSGVDVALKTLHPLLKSNPEEMEALRAKFALVSRLSHPNIASPLVLHPCRDIDITDDAARREMRLSPGDSVMVMRYAPGVTLSKWRRQFPDGVVPLDQALEVVRQVASALDYAHGEKIVHRDIKPANVMVETLPSEASR